MIEIRKAEDRGHANHGWLDSHHTFSFANYYDPEQMGWSALRVINDDTVAPAQGFGAHGHRNMEIFSYVLEGALAHKDSLGSGSVLRPGDVQLMSAGTGIRHSEFNGSQHAPTHFLQIWITPDETETTPGYQERFFTEDEKRGQLRLLVSPDGQDGALKIRQDARIYATLLDGKAAVTQAISPDRHGYVHVAKGRVTLNGHALKAGDGVRILDESTLTLDNGHDAEVLVFDLP